MQRKMVGLMAMVALMLVGCSQDTTYPGPWKDSGNAFNDIAITLGRNHILGCGEFYYKLADGEEDPGEALVYCTTNGRDWDSYLVFYKIDKVMQVRKEPEWTPPVSLLGTQ